MKMPRYSDLFGKITARIYSSLASILSGAIIEIHHGRAREC
jgi:hypothetical protein